LNLGFVGTLKANTLITELSLLYGLGLIIKPI